jgi:hypothetical protein
VLGVCCDPEQWPENPWAGDARRIADLGPTYVRIEEFAWDAIEPDLGRFDWGWLDRAVEAVGRVPQDRRGHADGDAAEMADRPFPRMSCRSTTRVKCVVSDRVGVAAA